MRPGLCLSCNILVEETPWDADYHTCGAPAAKAYVFVPDGSLLLRCSRHVTAPSMMFRDEVEITLEEAVVRDVMAS